MVCQIYLLIQSNLLTVVLDGGLLATGSAGYTSFIQLLQKTGANCNIHDDLGGLPIEIVAMYECKKEVELLLPLILLISNVRNGSVATMVMCYARLVQCCAFDKFLQFTSCMTEHHLGQFSKGMQAVVYPHSDILTANSISRVVDFKMKEMWILQFYPQAVEDPCTTSLLMTAQFLLEINLVPLHIPKDAVTTLDIFQLFPSW